MIHASGDSTVRLENSSIQNHVPFLDAHSIYEMIRLVPENTIIFLAKESIKISENMHISDPAGGHVIISAEGAYSVDSAGNIPESILIK